VKLWGYPGDQRDADDVAFFNLEARRFELVFLGIYRELALRLRRAWCSREQGGQKQRQQQAAAKGVSHVVVFGPCLQCIGWNFAEVRTKNVIAD
jgi:hypothetical protein